MDKIIILDFGGQYAHLIANRVRRLNVYSEILPPDSPLEVLQGVKGIILSGGPSSVYDADAPSYNPELITSGLPVLGLCYGQQLIAQVLGGKVSPGKVKEYGIAILKVDRPAGVLEGMGPEETVWMSHGDSVSGLPPGFLRLGWTDDCPFAAIGDEERHIYGFQFHPEVTHTPKGMEMLSRFLDICGCERTWTISGFVEAASRAIRDQVGERNVFLLVSGGIDSTVAFVLLNKALGPSRVLGLHIDNGFMRKDETRQVMEFLKANGFDNLHVVDASETFLEAVKGVVDPQEKRKIVGNVFLEVKDKVLDSLGLDQERWLLGQGTLYPDVIESGGSHHAALIKTHHNRVDLIQELVLQGKVVEPLAQLYKDEVREVGRQLGLPDALILRHPFPGPGLSVRALCSDGIIPEVPQEVHRRIEEIARRFGFESKVLPVRSVGVQGDFRTYACPAALIGKRNWRALEQASTAITNSVRAINRVIRLLAPEAIPDLRPKACYLTRPRLDLLREADTIAMEALGRYGLMEEVFQMPTVLIPLTDDGQRECVVLRPLSSKDVMTARFAELPEDAVKEMAERIISLPGIAAVFYDVTHKPPATMEWE